MLKNNQIWMKRKEPVKHGTSCISNTVIEDWSWRHSDSAKVLAKYKLCLNLVVRSECFYCVKAVEGTFKASGQTESLCTESTSGLVKRINERLLSTYLHTVFAHKFNSFTQAFSANFYLLAVYFYPLSTPPINTTNLIKE